MKTKRKPVRRQRRTAGFTLMEMTLALTLTMGVAATTVLMAGQHVSFLRLVGEFSFLRDEAPAVNLLLSRIIQQSEAYRIYPDKGSAFNGDGAVNAGGRALWLRFRNPDGATEQAVIAFEVADGETGLNFYNWDGASWSAAPAWTISSQPTGVTFSNDTGILLITVRGPNLEEITYVGNSE